MLYLNPKIKEISYFNYQPQSESFCQLYISTDKGSIITLSLETLIQSSELMLVLPNTKTPEKIHIFYNNIFLYECSQIGDSKGISAHPFGVFVLSNPLAGYSDQCCLINCNINLIDIINKSNLHLLDDDAEMTEDSPFEQELKIVKTISKLSINDIKEYTLFSETLIVMKLISVVITALINGSVDNISDKQIEEIYEKIPKSCDKFNTYTSEGKDAIITFIKIYTVVKSLNYNPLFIINTYTKLFEGFYQENKMFDEESIQNLSRRLCKELENKKL